MATSLSTFRESIRVIIGDNDPDIQMTENAQLDAAMRLTLDMGKVTGAESTGYAVDALRTSVTPSLTAADDPKAFGQLVYHTAKVLLKDTTPTSWRTRAFSETVGRNYEAVWHVLDEIHQLENGDGCDGSDYPE